METNLTGVGGVRAQGKNKLRKQKAKENLQKLPNQRMYGVKETLEPNVENTILRHVSCMVNIFYSFYK